jgi:hypothetical protein
LEQQIQVTLYNPHKNQKKIHDAINNGTEKYYVLNIGRQFGKTLLADNQALHWMFNEDKCKVGWVSPVYKQCKKVYEEIEAAFSSNPFVFSEKNKTDLTFKTINGSTLQFFSAERYDNIRGFTFDYLIIDEFAFVDEAAWTEVLRATVLVKGKKVLLISTPKGKNHFYTMHQLDGVNPQYKSFTMTSYDNPLINPTEIDDARITLPDHVFRQEYLAEFIDGGAGIFNPTFDDRKGGTLFYGGVDLGRADDYSVLSILNEKGEQVYCERWRHDSWSNISSKIAEKINEYKASVYIEVNSIGDAIFEQIKNLCNNQGDVYPFVTTSKSKTDAIESMAVATQNNELVFQPHDWLKKEFDVYTFEYNPKSRSVKYGAPYGFHDDGIMATAFSYQAMKHLRSSGEYFIS